VIQFLDEFGPGVGVPCLRDCFPHLTRVELEEMLKRYRRVWRERHRQPLRVLTWSEPGRVWAIDYAEAPTPIDGRCSYLLAVRDLASGMQLLWQPVEAATGENAARQLAALFAEHGPPLVLKSDNGSHFACEEVQDLLQIHRVECLFSPPHWPRFNGAIEAGIHSLKDRTAAHAARAGHPQFWTSDDTFAALAEMNAFARPHGDTRPGPEPLWQTRTPIDSSERDAFRTTVAAKLAEAKEAEKACERPTKGLWSEREMARRAIRQALEERGYLHYQRRRILPPIPRPKAARIT
jgi:transposase InsO family protein